jgi:hypothetical protein
VRGPRPRGAPAAPDRATSGRSGELLIDDAGRLMVEARSRCDVERGEVDEEAGAGIGPPRRNRFQELRHGEVDRASIDCRCQRDEARHLLRACGSLREDALLVPLLHRPEVDDCVGVGRSIDERVAVGTEQHQVRDGVDLRRRESGCSSARPARAEGDDVRGFREVAFGEREAVAEQVLVVVPELTPAARPDGEQDARHRCDTGARDVPHRTAARARCGSMAILRHGSFFGKAPPQFFASS